MDLRRLIENKRLFCGNLSRLKTNQRQTDTRERERENPMRDLVMIQVKITGHP